ncbi:cation/H(+) antiporter, partial [Streptomyces fulvissimus]|nr:cation/H(+) antiporter [Streptomyces microflavus]
GRLQPFIAGYVLILAVLAPLAAGRSQWLARLLPMSEPKSAKPDGDDAGASESSVPERTSV